MIVTIHQPEHLPWLGFFHKVSMADTYVVLDNVQYRRRYFQNRNKIRTKTNWQWITVPLEKDERDVLLIKNARITNAGGKWKSKNLESIFHNYHRATYFKSYWDDFKSAYMENHISLLDFNCLLLKHLFNSFNIQKDVLLASEIGASGEKGDLILNICKITGAKKYFSGISGKDYLDIDKFSKNNIEVEFQEFHHPIYAQLYDDFIPCMSALDLLFNHGPKSLDTIHGVDVPVMEEIFL